MVWSRWSHWVSDKRWKLVVFTEERMSNNALPWKAFVSRLCGFPQHSSKLWKKFLFHSHLFACFDANIIFFENCSNVTVSFHVEMKAFHGKLFISCCLSVKYNPESSPMNSFSPTCTRVMISTRSLCFEDYSNAIGKESLLGQCLAMFSVLPNVLMTLAKLSVYSLMVACMDNTYSLCEQHKKTIDNTLLCLYYTFACEKRPQALRLPVWSIH